MARADDLALRHAPRLYHVLRIFCALLHCQNLILQCSNSSPHSVSPSPSGRRSDPRMFPILLQQLVSRRSSGAHRAAPVPSAVPREPRAQADQSRAARRRRARRLHLGRARPDCSTTAALDDRGHLRHLGGRDERGDARRRARARRRRGGAQRLADFWRAASVDGHLPGLQRGVVERLFSVRPARGRRGSARMSRLLSPYDLNPLNINPLKDLIERFVDFDGAPRRPRSRTVHFGDQRAHRRAARVHAARRSRPKW